MRRAAALPEPKAESRKLRAVCRSDLRGDAVTIAAWVSTCFGLLAGAGDALASEALARQHGCFSCHSVERKVVGPAYKDIALKYRGDAGAEARLVEKLKKGGERTWGEIFMPPMPAVPEADIKTLVKWILSLK